MGIKKSKKVSLESKRGTFFLIGLIATLSFVWMSFEYKSYDKIQLLDYQGYKGEEEDLMIIQTKALDKPKPPKIVSTKIEVIVDPNVEVPDIDFNIETDEGDIIDDPLIDDGDDDGLVDEPVIFVPVEDQPSFPGGEEALLKYLSQIEYPEMAKESQIQGTVYVTFVVEKDGHISNAKVLRGIGGGCDEVSLKKVENMPKWSPGEQRGRAVRVRMNVPFRFVIAH